MALLALCSFCLSLGGCAAPKAQAQPIWDLDAVYTAVTALTNGEGAPLFDQLARPEQKELADVYRLDTSLCSAYLMGIDAKYNFFLVLHPAGGKQNDVKNNASSSLDSLSTQLELYAPDQSARVKSRLETARGEYLIYVASPDNNAVIDAIDDTLNRVN